MMQIVPQEGRIEIRCEPAEAGMLADILRQIITHYRVPPADVDPRVAAVWYSTRGCETAGLSESETRDWLASLHSGRLGTAEMLERCAASLLAPGETKGCCTVSADEAAQLVTALNDHRLHLAARHDFGEAEMALSFQRALERFSPDRCRVLFQVHLLGAVMEHLLQVIAPDATSWHQ